MPQSQSAQTSGGQKGQKGQAAGLLLVRITLGVYLFFMGVSKAPWLLDSTPLAHQLSQWLGASTPINLKVTSKVSQLLSSFWFLLPSFQCTRLSQSSRFPPE